MDYFKILNLKREPFSNSPEPEFFYQSTKHKKCLQKLEIAVRLRRGLNVVLGDVGTGKTTLCRQLIMKFAHSEGEEETIESRLLMDPGFTTSREFLSEVAAAFGIDESKESEWQTKENIKKYLFKKGVEEGKTVLLIIDEGQKLPDFCLEILREFLNYETNEFKLLQIVIFAQSEFQETLKRKANFTDRINLLYILKPLGFGETVSMVRHRIAKASDSDNPPKIFSFAGFFALYLSTGGYPRKIVTLCHQVVLALIIQNRSKAGWFLVRSCDSRVSPVKKRFFRSAAAAVLVLLFLAVIGVGYLPEFINITTEYGRDKSASNIEPQVLQTLPDIKKIDKIPVSEAVANVPAEKTALPKTMPEFLGKVKMKKGRTAWRLLYDFYGDVDGSYIKALASANPHIKNLNRVQAGETIKIPVIKSSLNPLSSAKYWIYLGGGTNLEDIYEFYRSYDSTPPLLKFIPYFNTKEGLVYAVFLKKGFDSIQAAEKTIEQLPEALIPNAVIVDKLPDETVFFQR